VISAYRLARGIGSAAALGRYYKGFECGMNTSVAGTLTMAQQIGMPPLLALLGTRPELLEAFDILDEDGGLLLESPREYARLVIVLLQRSGQASAGEPGEADEEPASPGLAAYLGYLLRRRGPVLSAEVLARHGVSPLLLANALAGRPPHQPEALQPLAALLELDPFEEARLCCDSRPAYPLAPSTPTGTLCIMNA
jgi:hypothetical protein